MDYCTIAVSAAIAIMRTMAEGEKKYPKNDYMDRPTQEHYDHVLEHMRQYKVSRDSDELEHALTRIAIMLMKTEEI